MPLKVKVPSGPPKLVPLKVNPSRAASGAVRGMGGGASTGSSGLASVSPWVWVGGAAVLGGLGYLALRH